MPCRCHCVPGRRLQAVCILVAITEQQTYSYMQVHCLLCQMSSGVLRWEAPVMIAEKRKTFFSSLSQMVCTSVRAWYSACHALPHAIALTWSSAERTTASFSLAAVPFLKASSGYFSTWMVKAMAAITAASESSNSSLVGSDFARLAASRLQMSRLAGSLSCENAIFGGAARLQCCQ